MKQLDPGPSVPIPTVRTVLHTMLPSKFFEPARRDDNSLSTQRCAPPPLGMTGVMCSTGRLEIPKRGTIHYRIFRPRQLKQKPPLILIHGGPLIPSNYLLPIAYVVVDRSIVVYDQLGCGQSSSVANPSVLTVTREGEKSSNKKHRQQQLLDVDAIVHDLDLLMDHWNFSQYTLLGHSFGGILVFEYLKYCQKNGFSDKLNRCKAVILASAPTGAKLVEQEVQRLCQDLTKDGEEDEEDDDEDGATALAQKVPKAFRERHECRLVPIPFPLMDSYAQAGPKHLRGLETIGNYVATLSTLDDDTNEENKTPTEEEDVKKLQPPVLVLRGQHDFVTEACVEGWDALFERRQHMTLAGCSHYGMLENEIMYGSVISSFLSECE